MSCKHVPICWRLRGCCRSWIVTHRVTTKKKDPAFYAHDSHLEENRWIAAAVYFPVVAEQSNVADWY